MSVQREHFETTQTERVRREYRSREDADHAVEQLRAAGFDDDEITLTTHGGRKLEDGTFQPGGVVVVVTTDPERAREVERIIS